MTGAAVTVVDRCPYSAVVSPEQAVAYCRRVLPKYREHPIDRDGEPLWVGFDAPDDLSQVLVHARSDFSDYARRVAELVDVLVRLGVASRPSDVLRAMAQEPPACSNYCPACDKQGVTVTDGRHVKCGGPVIEG